MLQTGWRLKQPHHCSLQPWAACRMEAKSRQPLTSMLKPAYTFAGWRLSWYEQSVKWYYTLTTCAVCELGTWFKEILGMTCWTIHAINTIISTGWRLNCILFACCHQVTHVYWRTFWITTNIAKLEVEQQVGGSAEALCPPIIRNHINTQRDSSMYGFEA